MEEKIKGFAKTLRDIAALLIVVGLLLTVLMVLVG